MFFTFLWCCLCNPPWVTGGLSDFKVLRRFNPTFSLRSQVYRWRRSVFFWHIRATLGLACAQAAILCTQVVGYSHNAGIRPATPSTIPVSSVSPPCVRNLSLGLCLRLQRMLSFLFLCPFCSCDYVPLMFRFATLRCLSFKAWSWRCVTDRTHSNLA